MKRFIPLLFLLVAGVSRLAIAQNFTELWKIDAGSDPRFPAASDFYRGAAYNPVTDHYLVVSRALGLQVYVLDAASGDLMDSLDVTGISGGTYALNEIEVTSAGVIYGANLTIQSGADTLYRIYRWADEAAVPSLAYVGRPGTARLGDVLDVAGAGTNTVIYSSGNNAATVIQRFSTTDGSLFTEGTPIPIVGQDASAGIAQVTPGGDAFISRFSGGNMIDLVDTNGAVLGSIPGTIAGNSTGDLCYFEVGERKFLLDVPAGATNNDPARLMEVTGGPAAAALLGITPDLGDNGNSNASGDVDVKIGTNDTVTVYVLVGNNGLAAFTGVLPQSVAVTISNVTRSTRVPMAGDSLVVTATIVDSSGMGIIADSLWYAIDGGAAVAVGMTRVSGDNLVGTYEGVVPGTANTDGARIEYQISATSMSGMRTVTDVAPANSYFAGMSPLSLTGLRAMAPSGQILYKGYYARVTGTVNGPNYQTTNLGYYMQDAVGGINIFAPGTILPMLNLGDSVVAIGKLDQYRGWTEIIPDDTNTDVEVVASGRPVAVQEVTLAAYLADPEPYESMVIRLNKLQRVRSTPAWPGLNGSANIMMYQYVATDTITMRIDSDTEIDGSPEPKYPVDVTGIAGQFTSSSSVYNNGFQILPRYLTDFTYGPVVISGVARSTRVPLAGDSVVVTATIADSSGMGIVADSLWYATDGGAAEAVAMMRVSGDSVVGTYEGVVPGTANTDGARIEYQVSATSLSGMRTVTDVAPANSYFAGTSPLTLTGLKAMGPNGQILYKGYYARVTGTVNGPNYQTTNHSHYIQDAVGGINIIDFGTILPFLNLGDSVVAVGLLDQYRGWTEVIMDDTGTDLEVVATGKPVAIQEVTLTAYLADPEPYESMVIRLRGLQRVRSTPAWPGLNGSANIMMYQYVPTDTITMRIDSDTEIDGSTEPTYPVDVTGIAGQFTSSSSVYNDGFQILPRYLTDFTYPTPGWADQVSNSASYLESVDAVNPSVAWVCGDNATLLRTVDGGATWTPVNGNLTSEDFFNISAVDAEMAVTTTSTSSGAYLFRTTNGGASWDTVFYQDGGFLNAIHMYDTTDGIAVGDPVGGKWTVLKTTDGGATWARIATEPDQVGGEWGAVNGLSTIGKTHIWFSQGTSTPRNYRSTDGGLTWASATTPWSSGFSPAIHFNDTQYGVAARANGTAAARSTDGGATWTSITIPAAGTMYGVWGSGLDFYITRGERVYRSTDRGVTWELSYGGGISALTHINMVTLAGGTAGWAISSVGGITSYNGTLTGVEDLMVQQLPVSYDLLQNYPNPFNPATTISYTLPEAAFVTLKVFNLLGQEVAQLVSEVQTAGVQTLRWEGRTNAGLQVASGVYLYRLEAKPVNGGSPFTSIKKMILLK